MLKKNVFSIIILWLSVV